VQKALSDLAAFDRPGQRMSRDALGRKLDLGSEPGAKTFELKFKVLDCVI
jgi:hypothetical protein